MNSADAQIEQALDAYHRVRQFEIEDRRHGVLMAVADLLIYSARSEIDADDLIAEARWLATESAP